jgi:transcriptional regulator with XRE-family HTH domain
MLPAASTASVGKHLRRLRLRRGHSLARVARASGVATRELEAIEQGRKRASAGILSDIASALETTLVEVIASQLVESRGWPKQSAVQRRLERIARDVTELPDSVGSKLETAIAAVVRHAMLVCNGNQSAAARLLGLPRKAFVRRWLRAQRLAARASRPGHGAAPRKR